MELEVARPEEISRNHFCKMLKISRSDFYYKPKGESQENIDLMNKMDKLSLVHSTIGVKTYVSLFLQDGIEVNHKRISRLMKVMNLECIYPKKCLSKNDKVKYRFPYLLSKIDIIHSNQVWSTDISYIKMPHGFMYLYAIIDVYSRCILGWRLSNSLTTRNCAELLKECIDNYGKPEIVNTDQGVQYTSNEWIGLLENTGIRISMDGRGRYKDNIWIERFWRTVKQEYIYLNPTDDCGELRRGIGHFIDYYNYKRPHQGIHGLIPYNRYNTAA